MKVIDVYKQYFNAECVYNEVERKGAVVNLTATSDSGKLKTEQIQKQYLKEEQATR